MSALQPVTFYVPRTAAEPIELDVAHSGLRMVLVGRESIHMLGGTWDVLGIYFLLGPADDPDRYRAYVGEVGRRTLRMRLREHVATRDFWNRALLVASSSDTFNSAEIGWLEGRLYDVLNNAVAAEVVNRGRPGDDSIALRDRGVLERYVEPIMAALRACGASPDTADQKPEPRGRRRQARYGESVRDLIEVGLLKPGTRLVALRRGLAGMALVLADGGLEVDGIRYDHLSPAAIAVSGKQSEPGWDFWGAPSGEGGYVPLARLRQRLRDGDIRTPLPASPLASPAAAPAPTASAGVTSPRGSAAAQRDVTLLDLLAAGLLAAGEPLVAVYKGNRLQTSLLAGGRVRGIAGGPDGTLSSVARQLTGSPVNGWRFWSVEREGRLVKLARIREQQAQRGGG
jgi:hypothetical protein